MSSRSPSHPSDPPARPGADPPILARMPEILEALSRRPNLVLEAEPGAGKTTRVPLALLESGLADPGEIWVLQPRRIAARVAAGYVAELLGEPVGERCGYQVRFESKRSTRTRIVFMTEALATQRLRSDPTLSGVSAVFLDEFHERHIAGDLALALLRRLQTQTQTTGDSQAPPRIIVMSATMDGAPVARFLDAPHIRCPGRSHPVEIGWLGDDATPRAQRAGQRARTGFDAARVAAAVRRLVDDGLDGHVLVFLPGAREIRETTEACAPVVRRAGLVCTPLYGDLSMAEQDAALGPSPQTKLILATNIAETSLTIDGVAAVIDTGLARVASHNPWSGLPRLALAPISQASAIQRAGRAGRTRPGRCLRLYDAHDFARRPAHDAPEVARLDLSTALLEIQAAGVSDPRTFVWFETPPAASLEAAQSLLARLGATDHEEGRISATGRAMLRFPLHPRQARLLVEGEARGVGDLAAGAAALLAERPIRRRNRATDVHQERHDADVLADLALLDAWKANRGAAARLGLDDAACRQVDRARTQLLRLLSPVSSRAKKSQRDGRRRESKPSPASALDGSQIEARERALRMALLCAYPDRVAKVRPDAGGGHALVLCGGGSARLGRESVVADADWVVALALEERRESGGRDPRNMVSSAAAIEVDWLLDLLPDALEERVELSWNAERERVEGVSELVYENLVVESSPLRRLPPQAESLLRDAALTAGPERFVREPHELASLLARIAFLCEQRPELARFDDADVRDCLAALCEGKSTFREIEQADLLAHLLGQLHGVWGERAGAELERLAPRFVSIPGRRRVEVHYEAKAPPWIASRLQDFFGLSEGPRVDEGRVPLVLHLLAPNQRAVQVTSDLSGFWERHYPGLRRSLGRRYPRHAWPEDPLTPA